MLPIQNWLPDASQSIIPDLVAGLSLWALLVPQSIAYAKLAGAPNLAAGLYCIIFVLPVYALFASSRSLVASPTTAVSATFAGFMASMASPPEAALAALVLATAVTYLLFAYFRLGFLTYFISRPVSAGYMTGLSLIVIIGQMPILFGFDAGNGNAFEQAVSFVQNLDQTNFAALGFAAATLILLALLPRISRLIPTGLVALALALAASVALDAGDSLGLSMVGALPAGAPRPALPMVSLDDFAIIIPAAIGLVILASGEASVTAQTMAARESRLVDMNQQFRAFGMGNLVGGFFGAIPGTGASSATVMNVNAGARTLVSTFWASAATLLTVMFLTGIFAYLPHAFLAALVVTAVADLLFFRQIWKIRQFSHGEFIIASLAIFAVLLFGILNGLLMSMIINVLYVAYASARIETTTLGQSVDDPNMLLPQDNPGTRPLPDHVLAVGLRRGNLFYASAPTAFSQVMNLIVQHPDARVIVMSVGRMDRLDYSSREELLQFAATLRQLGKTLHITDVHSTLLRRQLADMAFDPEWVEVTTSCDPQKL
ncbi:MAG: SulP family inorganic anion transporter [Sphingomonadaceae bacterium]